MGGCIPSDGWLMTRPARPSPIPIHNNLYDFKHAHINMDNCVAREPSFCKEILTNPDISGIGVRVAMYGQTIISIVILYILPFHEKAFRDTLRNSHVASTSLIFTSLIKLKTHGLSLLDALIVTMLTTTVAGLTTANSSHTRSLGLSVHAYFLLCAVFWVYWGLQVWNDPKTFGIPRGEENCTASIDTVFVVFGHNVSVTDSGLRGFAIFIFASGSLAALAALWQCINLLFLYVIGSARSAKQNAAARYAKTFHNQRGVMRRGRDLTMLGSVVGMIYMIVTTEQIVQRNQVVSGQIITWTYSQTIALILLGQQFRVCGTYLKEEIKYRRDEQLRLWKTAH